jgi:hypothetical protein
MSLPQGQPIGSRVIATKKPDGRSAIMAAFKELRHHGYVDQESHRKDDGTFTTTTHVYEVPPGAKTEPGSDSPGSDNPGSENRPISLREKDEEMNNQGQVLRVCCGENFTSLELYQDHLETCIEANDWTPAAKLKLL